MAGILLTLGANLPVIERLIPVFQRAELEIHHAEDGGDAVRLVAAERFDLIIARYPFAGVELSDLVAAVRSPQSPCRDCALLLIAEPAFAAQVGGFLGRGVNRIASPNAPSERLVRIVAELIEVAHRRALRAAITIEVWMGHDRLTLITETANISTTGMLVHGARQIPVGARVTFELRPGRAIEPVRGEAEVVRHTDPEREGLIGVAARIVSFHDDGLRRLAELLDAE